jgi:hypothetical protein
MHLEVEPKQLIWIQSVANYSNPRNKTSAESIWANHLLFRSGQAIFGLSEKDLGRPFSSKVFMLTIIAAQHLALPCFDLSDAAKTYCLITSSSAKQVVTV